MRSMRSTRGTRKGIEASGEIPSPQVSLPATTRKRKTAKGNGSGNSSAEEPRASSYELQQTVNDDHDNKENIDNKRQTRSGKAASTQPSHDQTKPPARRGKQRAQGLSNVRKTSGSSVSTSVEPESLDEPEKPVATKSTTGRKRGRPRIESEDSGSQEQPKAKKRTRLQDVNSKTGHIEPEAHSTETPIEFTLEEQQAAEHALQPDNIHDQEFTSDTKLEFYDMVKHAIWQDNRARNGRRRGQPRKMAFKRCRDGKYVVARKNEDTKPSELVFLDPVAALAILKEEAQLRATQRKKDVEEQNRQAEEREEQEQQNTAHTLTTFGTTGMQGIRIRLDREGHATDSTPDLAVGTDAHEDNEAMEGLEIAVPDASQSSPSAAILATPPRPSHGRFTSFVHSVTRPLSGWVPGFRRSNAAEQLPTLELPANGPVLTSPGGVIIAKRRSSIENNSPNRNRFLFTPEDRVNTTGVNTVGKEDLSAATLSGPSFKESELELNRDIPENIVPLPDTTAMALQPHENGDPEWTTPNFRAKSIKVSVEKFIAKEVNRRVAEQIDALQRKYKAQALLQVKKATEAAKAEVAKRIQEMEHRYAARADERIEAAKKETEAEIIKLRAAQAEASTAGEAPASGQKRKRHRRPRIGDPELPLIDGMIPGPRKGGYGIDDDYLYAPYSDESSEFTDEEICVVKTVSLQKGTSTQRDAPSAAKRRRVTFDRIVHQEPITPQKDKLPRNPTSTFKPVSVLKQKSSYQPTVEDDLSPEKQLPKYSPTDKPSPSSPSYASRPGRTYCLDYNSFSDDEDEEATEASGKEQPLAKPIESKAQAKTVEERGSVDVGKPQAEKATEKDAESMRRMKEKADYVRDAKYMPKTPSKLRETKRVSASPQSLMGIEDVMAKYASSLQSGSLSVLAGV
ncbi:MAG: hypothetical protein LQ340_002794 [Diploschistes diacapsis]|nr:MAG: hypothetical protein LQ340_002794 [Diploschistes diacapsis]